MKSGKPVGPRFDLLDIAIILYLAFNVYMIPHTKIEEIFQVNNMYDHLYLQDDIPNYDYIIFDGVVYRTFISSLMIAAFVFPLKILVHSLGLTSFSMLIICKGISRHR